MKEFIICFFAITMNCMAQTKRITNYKQPMEFYVEVPDTITKNQKNILIKLSVKNFSGESITVPNPAHWGNAYPQIQRSGVDIPITKIKINPKLLNEKVIIEKDETFETYFDFSLDKIIGLEHCKTGEYEIFFNLRGLYPLKSVVRPFLIEN